MFTRTTKKSIGRLAAATIAAGVGIVGLGAAPALADQTVEFGFTDVFLDVNPCTGEEIEITINLEIREHQGHDRNFVARVSRTGTTSDGYVMDHGRESFTANDNVASGSLADTWRNEEGSMFKAQGHFVEKEDGIVVDTFRLRCIKA